MVEVELLELEMSVIESLLDSSCSNGFDSSALCFDRSTWQSHLSIKFRESGSKEQRTVHRGLTCDISAGNVGKHGIANADSQPWPDSMALKIISNKILLRFPKSWGTPKTSILGFHDCRKPHMLSPLPQRILLSKGSSTKILAEHMTLTQWYPYAPCMEYWPPFALKITQLCRLIYQHHGAYGIAKMPIKDDLKAHVFHHFPIFSQDFTAEIVGQVNRSSRSLPTEPGKTLASFASLAFLASSAWTEIGRSGMQGSEPKNCVGFYGFYKGFIIHQKRNNSKILENYMIPKSETSMNEWMNSGGFPKTTKKWGELLSEIVIFFTV